MIIGCTKDQINYENLLYEEEGVFYGKESNKPYSGKVFSLYGDGKKKTVGNLKNGKSNGLWIWFHENGVKKYEGTWKNGNLNGLRTEWYKNGNKKQATTFIDNKKDGMIMERKSLIAPIKL